MNSLPCPVARPTKWDIRHSLSLGLHIIEQFHCLSFRLTVDTFDYFLSFLSQIKYFYQVHIGKDEKVM